MNLRHHSLESPLVYIVDNDLISVFDIQIRIHRSNIPCRVESHNNVEEALQVFESSFRSSERRPDIILISFDLPGMDGPMFLNHLKNYGVDFEQTDVYVFSAYGISEEQQDTAELKNIRGVFTKPLTMKEIKTMFHTFHKRRGGGEISA